MRIVILLLFCVLFGSGIENNRTKPSKSKKDLGIFLPFEAEMQTIKMITNNIINYDNTLNSIKKAYSKPLNNYFEYLEEFENSIREK